MKISDSKSLLLLLMVITTLVCNSMERIYSYQLPEIIVKAKSRIDFNKSNLNLYPAEYILAGIAEHECGSLSQIERYYIMEAVWNRVQDNFGNHGNDIVGQLLAPRQFTGLFTINPKHFSVNFKLERNRNNIRMAKKVIEGARLSKHKKIYYWAGICDMNTKHYAIINRVKIKTLVKTKNIFA